MKTGISIQHNITGAISFMFVILLLSFSFFCWQYGDDYLYLIALRDSSIFEHIIYLYMNWDGRHFSLAGLFQAINMKYFEANQSIFLSFLVYYFCSYIFLKILNFSVKLKLSVRSIFIFFSFFLFAFWPLYKDVLFWQIGATVHSFFLLQGALIIYFINNFFLRRFTNHPFGWIGLIIFFCALNTQNIMLPILFLSIFLLITKSKYDDEFKINYYVYTIFYFFPILLGIIITTFAPGNFLRLNSAEGGFDSFGNLPINFIKIYFKFFIYSKWSFVSGLCFAFLIDLNIDLKIRKHVLFNSVLYMLMAIVSILPFLLSPTLARIRVYFFGMIFIFISSIFFGIWVKSFLSSKLLVFKYAFGIIPILSGIFLIISQLLIMIPFSKRIDERAKFLAKQRSSAKEVLYQKIEKPEKLYFIRWPNIKNGIDWNSTSEYYQIKYREY